ncbi:hypothetical protein FRC11_002103, partial [Ceratobasidium sp. 423]
MFQEQSERAKATPASGSTVATQSLIPSETPSCSSTPFTVSCHGLWIEHDKYLLNVTNQSPIGGRTSIWVMAHHIYNTKYGNLTPAQKDE